MKFKTGFKQRVAVVLIVLFTLPTLWFGHRCYRSFVLLHSAYQAGLPETSSIRPWMTLTYLADTYHLSVTALIANLGLPPDTAPTTDLHGTAALTGLSSLQYIARTQGVIAALGGSEEGPGGAAPATGWLATISDKILSGLLVYGYPILGLIQAISAVGVPIPGDGAAAAAGSLVAQGRMNWLVASIVVIVGSVLGDIASYGLGLAIGREFLERHGRWFGYNPARGDRVEWLFEHWGTVTVFITRTFVSYLCSAVSLLAGVSRYDFFKFAATSIAGRAVWTAAYLGLGYAIGANLDAATGFLGNLSGFLLCALVLVAAGFVAATSSAESKIPADGVGAGR